MKNDTNAIYMVERKPVRFELANRSVIMAAKEGKIFTYAADWRILQKGVSYI